MGIFSDLLVGKRPAYGQGGTPSEDDPVEQQITKLETKKETDGLTEEEEKQLEELKKKKAEKDSAPKTQGSATKALSE